MKKNKLDKRLEGILSGRALTIHPNGQLEIEPRPEKPESIELLRKHKRRVIYQILSDEYQANVETTRRLMAEYNEGRATAEEFEAAYRKTEGIERLLAYHGASLADLNHLLGGTL